MYELSPFGADFAIARSDNKYQIKRILRLRNAHCYLCTPLHAVTSHRLSLSVFFQYTVESGYKSMQGNSKNSSYSRGRSKLVLR